MSTRQESAKSKKNRSKQSHSGPIVLLVAVFIIAIGLIQVFTTFHQYAMSLSELNSLKKQESSLVAEQQELENDIDRWNDDAYVTAQARERLGYVFEGEQPIRVLHPEAVTGDTQEDGDQNTSSHQEHALPWYSELSYSFQQSDTEHQE